MRQEEYLQILTEQIRCKKARGAVAEEIKGHIEEQKIEFMSAGIERREAEEAAVREMGDPVEAGNELDRIHRPKMAWGMIAFITVLSIAGLLLQYFLKLQMKDSTILVRGLGHNLFYMVVGLGIMILVCHLDYSRIGYWAKELMVLLAAALVLNVWLFGAQVNGRYYFTIPIIGSIPMMFLFLLFVPLYAGVLYSFRGQGARALIKSIALMALILFGAVWMNSLSTAFILFPAFLASLSTAVYKGWFTVPRKKTLAVLWSGVALLPAALYMMVMQFGAGYQIMRLQAWLSPDSAAEGYQINMVRSLLAESILWGKGTATERAVLPESGDYIFTYAAVYYGILVTALLAVFIGILFLRLLRLSFGQKNQMGMLMGMSCSVTFLVQFILYVLLNVGLLPSTSIYCPFVTNGASGMLITYTLLGLILSIYRYQNVIPQKSTAEGKKMWI